MTRWKLTLEYDGGPFVGWQRQENGLSVQEVMERMRKEGLSDVPVVVGGIIPPEDERTLKAFGVAAVYTPKNFQLNDIMADIVRLVGSQAMAA